MLASAIGLLALWPRPLRPMSYQRTIHAIARALLRQCGERGIDREQEARLAILLVTMVRSAPDHLRLALLLLMFFFDAVPCLTRGRPFHALDEGEQGRRIASWEGSRLGLQRGFILFFRSFALFDRYSHEGTGAAARRSRDAHA